MVNCSLMRKDDCVKSSKCSWVVGKGCRSDKRVQKKAPKSVEHPKHKTLKHAMPPKVKKIQSDKVISLGPGVQVVLTGFRDEALVEAIKSRGASVVSKPSSKTNGVIKKTTSTDTSSVHFARANGLWIMTREQFVSQFKLTITKKDSSPKSKVTGLPSSLPVKTLSGNETAKYVDRSLAVVSQQVRVLSYAQFKKTGFRVMDMGSFLAYDTKNDVFLRIAKVKKEKNKYSIMLSAVGLEGKRASFKGLTPIVSDVSVADAAPLEKSFLMQRLPKQLVIIQAGDRIFARVNKVGSRA